VSGERALRYAAILFAVAFVFHNADHFRRGTDVITDELLWAGTAAGIVSIATIVIVLLGHPSAPYLAIVAGFTLALGFAASHIFPTWSALSDSFVDGDVSGVSWAAAILEIVGAATLGAAGVYALRRRAAASVA
jgi:hypothetical protein